jgi:hypothetical protein
MALAASSLAVAVAIATYFIMIVPQQQLNVATVPVVWTASGEE